MLDGIDNNAYQEANQGFSDQAGPWTFPRRRNRQREGDLSSSCRRSRTLRTKGMAAPASGSTNITTASSATTSAPPARFSPEQSRIGGWQQRRHAVCAHPAAGGRLQLDHFAHVRLQAEAGCYPCRPEAPAAESLLLCETDRHRTASARYKNDSAAAECETSVKVSSPQLTLVHQYRSS